MNKADKERQKELLIKIWSIVAKKHRINLEHYYSEPKDPFILNENSIESHKGRINKALRLLDGYIKEEGKTEDGDKLYRILRMEESKPYGIKPEMETSLNQINKEILSCLGFAKRIIHTGYKEALSSEEEIYIYWHKDEYDKDIYGSVYEKSLLDNNTRRILRTLVEIKLKKDFPGYVQMIAPKIRAISYEENRIPLPIPLQFHKFDLSNLEKDLNEYKVALEFTNYLTKDINEILKEVDSRGGFKEVIKQIRKQIITDFLDSYERFPQGFNDKTREILFPGEKDTYKNPGDAALSTRSHAEFKIFDKFRHLASYESLYCDPVIGGEEVTDMMLYSYSCGTGEIICSFSEDKYKEEFLEDETQNTRVA